VSRTEVAIDVMWKSISCEVQGRHHIRSASPCQDKTIVCSRNGISIIALADGAGSARLSHFGAECAINSASDFIANNFFNLIKTTDGRQVKLLILDTIRTDLENIAKEYECTLNDLASTLLLVAVCEEWYIIIHIGDGVIGYLDGTDLKIASFPDNGECSNMTTFVTSNSALASMRLFKGNINDISGFVIMSDGTGQSLYHKPTKTLANATIKLMQRNCLLNTKTMKTQLHNTLAFIISKKTDDDCSIAILSREHGVLRPYENLNFLEKCDLLNIKPRDKASMKRVIWFDAALQSLVLPKSIKQLSHEFNLKPKYIKRIIESLTLSGLVENNGALYYRSQ
jgi:serine/threonine protein phosphatase PrpC